MITSSHKLMLTLVLWMLPACTAVQNAATPLIPIQTPTQELVVQPISTVYTKPTKPTKTQTATLSPVPSLLNSLPRGTYIAVSGNEGSGFDSIPSIHILSLNGEDIGILAKNVSEKATISPDGKEIAYIKFTEFGPSLLTILNLKTNQAKDVFVSGCSMPDSTVGWSSDSKQVAITCGRYLSIADITGKKAEVVSTLLLSDRNDVDIIDPLWSPDGNYLSFYIADLNDAHDSSSHGPYLLNPKCPNDELECQVSPQALNVDGMSLSQWTSENLLAVAQNNRIYLFDPATRQRTRAISIPTSTPILSFAWSPDNQSIAYLVASQTPGVLADEIYISSPSGGKLRLLTDHGNKIMFWIQIE